MIAAISTRQCYVPSPFPLPIGFAQGGPQREGFLRQLKLKTICCLLGCLCIGNLALAAAQPTPNSLTPQEQAEGWVLLFDGATTFGWRAGTKANWSVADGTISVSEGESGLLYTTSEFGDFALRAQFRCPATTNSGIFLRTSPQPKDPTRDCYELNIATPDVSPFSTGSLVARKKVAHVRELSGWRDLEVVARGGHFYVTLDGKPTLDYTDPHPLGRGHIGLQFNRGRVDFRAIKLRPLDLVPLLAGKDLAGWKVYPGKPGKFTLSSSGELEVRGGPGQIETQQSFADFILAGEVRVGTKNGNSGIFFRNIPGEFALGYECQIHNGFMVGDRSLPLDCGTGGFYRRQNARRIVGDDFRWFQLTLAVSGKHMAAWVNGYQVSDWTDTRMAHENPRRGLRTGAGTLALQAHDQTTSVSFRNLRAAELPAR